LTIVSVSQDVPLASYNLILYFASAFSAVFFLSLILHVKFSVKKSSVYTFIFFAFFYYAAYSKADKFYELTLNESYITLKYVSPSQDKLILKSDVKSVTFGYHDRGARGCYIALNTQSGNKYKSTLLTGEIEICKAARKELLKQLALES